MAYVSLSLSVCCDSYGGSLSKFMHVAEVGNRASSALALWMQKAGCSHRKPMSGGREHEVTNLSVAARRGPSYCSTT